MEEVRTVPWMEVAWTAVTEILEGIKGVTPAAVVGLAILEVTVIPVVRARPTKMVLPANLVVTEIQVIGASPVVIMENQEVATVTQVAKQRRVIYISNAFFT